MTFIDATGTRSVRVARCLPLDRPLTVDAGAVIEQAGDTLSRSHRHGDPDALVVHLDDHGHRAARTLDGIEHTTVDAGRVNLRAAVYNDFHRPPPRPQEQPAMPLVDTDELLARLSTPPPTGTAATWQVLERAAEHIVSTLDAANAAAPHGTFITGDEAWDRTVLDLFAERLDDVVGRFPLLVERTSMDGMPLVPELSFPTAGKQAGQKNEATSDAFTVDAAASPTLIDSTLYLNVSLQLDRALPGVTEAFMTLAVAAETEKQIVAAIESGATAAADQDAAFSAFTGGMWRPGLLIVPPSAALGLAGLAQLLDTIAVDIAVVPTATQMTLLDPLAVAGWLAPLMATALEPALVGKQTARAMFGQVAVTGTGAQTYPVPTTP